MSESGLIAAIASNGAVGVGFALLVFHIFRKDAELKEAKEKHIDDVKAYARLASELQERVHESCKLQAQTVDKLIEYVERKP